MGLTSQQTSGMETKGKPPYDPRGFYARSRAQLFCSFPRACKADPLSAAGGRGRSMPMSALSLGFVTFLNME